MPPASIAPGAAAASSGHSRPTIQARSANANVARAIGDARAAATTLHPRIRARPTPVASNAIPRAASADADAARCTEKYAVARCANERPAATAAVAVARNQERSTRGAKVARASPVCSSGRATSSASAAAAAGTTMRARR